MNKIPSIYRTPTFEPFEAKALNQELTDSKIITTIASSYYEDRRWNSAIKIGDIWFSIPSKYISIYHPSEKKWDLWENWAERDSKFLNGLNLPRTTRDPMEKFVGFQTPLQNNITNSERVGALTNLVVNNNKPADKVLTLTFECKSISIQNNFRPLFAQFLLAPFLPVHNADLNMIVQPHDDSPEAFLAYKVAHLDEDGVFRFGTREQLKDNITNIRDEMVKAGVEQTLVETIVRQKSSWDEYCRLQAYWKVPFYVNLQDFNIESMPELEASFRVTLVLHVISPVPAYGELPQYIVGENAVTRHFELQKVLERAHKGDNSLMEKITRMFNLSNISGDGTLKGIGGENFYSYNLFDRAIKNEIVPETVLDIQQWATAINTKDGNKYNKPYGAAKGGYSRPFVDYKDKSDYPVDFTKVKNPLIKTWLYDDYSNVYNMNISESIAANPVNNLVPYGNLKTLKIGANTNPEIFEQFNKKQEDDKKFEETIRKTNITLRQYNVKNWYKNFNTDKVENGYHERLRRYAYMFDKSKADIITLQELGKEDGLVDLCRVLNDKNINPDQILWNYAHASNGPNIGIGLITKLNILDHKYHTMDDIIRNNTPLVEYIVSQIGRSEANKMSVTSRPILEVTLEKESGNKLTVFVVHFRSKLDIKNENIRKIESWLLIKAILELPEDRPYIITGDFNYGMFEEESASRPENALGLYTNRITTVDEKITHLIQRFGQKTVNLKQGDAEFPMFLDLPVCFELSTMKQLATINPGLKTDNESDIESNYIEYYKGILDKYRLSNYKINTGNDLKRLITYHFLGEDVKTKNGFHPRNKFTFNNLVVENLENGVIDTSKTRNSIIDHILFSYHFFEKPNLDVNVKSHTIVNGYNSIIEKNGKKLGKYYTNLQQLASDWDNGGFVKENIFTAPDLEIWRTYLAPLLKEADIYLKNNTDTITNKLEAVNVVANQFINGYRDDYWTEVEFSNDLIAIGKFIVTNKEYSEGVIKKISPDPKVIASHLMSDHFPIEATFTWKMNTISELSDRELEVIKSKPYYFEGSLDTKDPLSAIEFFPHVDLYKDKFNSFWEKNINAKKELLSLDYTKQFSALNIIKENTIDRINVEIEERGVGSFKIPVNAYISIKEKPQGIDYHKVLVTGIYFSIINQSYVVVLQTPEDIAMFPMICIPSDMHTWLQNWTEYENKKKILTVIVDSLKFYEENYDIKNNKNIKTSVSTNTALLGGVEIDTTKKYAIFISTGFPSSSELEQFKNNGEDQRKEAPGFPKIEKTLFEDYFKIQDDYYKGVSPVDPSELSLNISHCQPFRNYYLPLLAEFREAVKDFNWEYNYTIDMFEPFLYDYTGHVKVEQKLMFTRKKIKKSGRSLLGIIENAVEVLAGMVEGREEESEKTDAYRRRYFGQIGELLMYQNYSIRIQNIIREALKTGKYPDETRREIILNLNPAYKNVLIVETLMYLGVQISRVLLLLDKDTADSGIVQQALYERPSYSPTFINMNEEFFKSEMLYTAFIAFNTTVVKLKKEREKVERFLKLNFEMRSKTPDDSRRVPTSNSFDFSDNKPVKIEEMVKLFKDTRDKMLLKIVDLSKKDSQPVEGNFAMEVFN